VDEGGIGATRSPDRVTARSCRGSSGRPTSSPRRPGIRKDDPKHNDADYLARKTLIPGSAWILGWAVVIIWALWTGVPLLFSHAVQ